MKGIGSWPKGPSMNVQGWERGASVGGGLALIGFGLRRGGLLGLLGAAADWALSVGADRLALAVGRANTAARAAYDKLGFAEVGAYDYWSG